MFCQVKKKNVIQKFKWFQIKINSRNLVTNSVLRDMGVVGICVICAIQTETLSVTIILWQCQQTRAFWTEFERCLKEKCVNCNTLILITPALILFGCDEKIKTFAGFDYIILVVNSFCLQCRINQIRPRVQYVF